MYIKQCIWIFMLCVIFNYTYFDFLYLINEHYDLNNWYLKDFCNSLILFTGDGHNLRWTQDGLKFEIEILRVECCRDSDGDIMWWFFGMQQHIDPVSGKIIEEVVRDQFNTLPQFVQSFEFLEDEEWEQFFKDNPSIRFTWYGQEEPDIVISKLEFNELNEPVYKRIPQPADWPMSKEKSYDIAYKLYMWSFSMWWYCYWFRQLIKWNKKLHGKS